MNTFKHIKTLAVTTVALMGMASCDSYLDKLPDDRAELDTDLKINQLLMSAYPTCNNILIQEMRSDNMGDNGRSYSSPVICEDLYLFDDTSEEGNDTPYYIWNGYYESVATVNEALKGVADMGNPESLRGAVAEAKMIRAYSMFQLAQTFCMAWDESKADEYLGLPYPTEPETDINTVYTRGTLRQLYEAIDKDIEEALPDINIAAESYKIPKYHFNLKAAYAFAARFNLYYGRWEKTVEYANQVLGNDPTTVMRNFTPYYDLGYQDFANQWIRSEEDANIMLLASYSTAPRYLTGSTARYAHNMNMASYETFWVDMPWGGGSSNNTIIYANKLYGSNQRVVHPTLMEQFEYTDKVAGIGYVHAVDPIFTGDMTILERAEALCLLRRYSEAVRDINTWITTHCKEQEGSQRRPTMDVASIDTFIVNIDYAKRQPDGFRDRSMRKHMHPQGFTIDAEGSDQECMLQFILHMKRIETVFHGIRMMDLKRYGIEYAHQVSGESDRVFVRGDLRGACQIPNTVIAAGLEGNPRQSKEWLDGFIQSTKQEYGEVQDEEEE